MVFLVFSLVFSCYVYVFLGILLYLISSPVSVFVQKYHSITKKSRAISCHSLFPVWECKQTWLLLNVVPTIDFTSSQFPNLQACSFIKKRLQHRCFRVKFSKCLRTSFLQNISGGCFWELAYILTQHFLREVRFYRMVGIIDGGSWFHSIWKIEVLG